MAKKQQNIEEVHTRSMKLYEIPIVTREEMSKLDEWLMDEFRLDLEQMMENAGKNLAWHIVRTYPDAKMIVVLAGPGNNGGGGIVAARHLRNWGRDVVAVTTRTLTDLEAVPRHQALLLDGILVGSKLADERLTELLTSADVIVDALLGYNGIGEPRGEVGRMIELLNNVEKSIVALDNPSGLDADTGEVGERVVRATATLTLAAPKIGLLLEDAVPYVGDLFLSDISVPIDWYRKMGFARPFFVDDPVVQIA